MLISHRKHFIFTKTVKTAGTSVESFFEEYCMPSGSWSETHQREEYVSEAGIIGYRGPKTHGKKWYNHMPAAEIRALIGEKVWLNYFKFTVIRNPFTKLVSAFFYFFPPSSGAKSAKITEFRHWVASGNMLIDRNKYTIDGVLCVDDIIRFETLDSEVDRICRKLEIPVGMKRLPLFKKRGTEWGLELQELYDYETRNIVELAYAWELENFKYGFPSSASL